MPANYCDRPNPSRIPTRQRPWRRFAGLLAVAVVAMPGCGAVSQSSGGAHRDAKTIGVSMPEFQSMFYTAAVHGMKKAADAAGYKLVVLNANANAQVQINQVQNLITRQVGAVIFAMQDSTSGAASVREANAAKTPLIAIDQRPPSGQVTTFVGSDAVAAGTSICNRLMEQINHKGKIAVIEGVAGASTQIDRAKGCKSVLDKNPEVKVVATSNADWDQNKAYNVAQNILTAQPDLQGIFAQNDGMAIGAAKAAKAAGRKGIQIVSVDGFPTIYPLIETGAIDSTMSQQPHRMGELAVASAIKAMKGESIPKQQITGMVLVDKAGLATAKSNGYYGPAE